jgi:ATP-dependent DNA helicase RecQ
MRLNSGESSYLPMSSTSQVEPEAFLEKFGLSNFREGQREVITTVISGRDCMCIMTTGGGKSLCYQLPALAREGVTLVVSPLIALMKDQVDALQKLGLRASFINSSLSSAEQAERFDMLAAGGYDLLYVAPERFRHQRFRESLKQTKLALLAIDEAHCISEWGHDFRPDYARLGEYRRRLGNPPTIALTATATKLVRNDVVKVLGLADPNVFITGFGRPNLRFEVQTPTSQPKKTQALLDFLAGCEGGGIIYAATRKRCDELVELIGDRTKRKVGMYHAGMDAQQRRHMQENFMDGRIDTIVATNAFGMGIDKSDLRFVVHFNMPGTLEAFYQEAGRAGRDGLNSRCLLLYSASDRYIQEFFIENAYPQRETIKIVWEFLCEQEVDPIELTQEEIKESLGGGLAAGGIGASLQILDRAGAIERLAPQQNMAAVRIDSDTPRLVELLPPQARSQRKVVKAFDQLVGDRRGERIFFTLREAIARCELEHDAFMRSVRELNRHEWFSFVPPFRGKASHVLLPERQFEELEIDFEKLDRLREAEYTKLDLVVKYANTRNCRQLEILDYFGDPHREVCGSCDRCDPSGKNTKQTKAVTSSATPSNSNTQLDTDRLSQVARMALSGVARADARFGKKLIAQMLFGSDSAPVRKWKLERLSTYGLLSHLQLGEVEQILDALMAAGLVLQKDIDRFRPVVELSPEGSEVMMGTAPLPASFGLPEEILLKIGAVVRKPLRENKQEEQPAERKVRENDVRENAVQGRGERGEGSRLDAGSSRNDVSEVSRESSAASQQVRGRCPLPLDDAPQPSYYWTWHLLADGFPWSAMLSIRGLASTTALAHLQQAIAQRREVQPGWFLSAERLAEIETACAALDRPHLGTLQESLGDGWLLEEIDLYLKCSAGK